MESVCFREREIVVEDVIVESRASRESIRKVVVRLVITV